MAKVLVLPVIALALLVATAACNNGQAESTPQTLLHAAAPASEEQKKPSPTPEPAKRAIPKDGALMLKQLATDITSATYKVVYDITGNDREGKLTGAFTLAADDGRQLLGFQGKVGALEGHFVVIDAEEASYLCIDGQGQKACLKSKADGPSPIPLPTAFSVDGLLGQLATAPGLAVASAGKEKIAGADAHCWDVSSDNGKGRICVADADGSLLSLDGDFQGAHLSLKAREITSPGAKEFDPPYPVVDLGG